MCEATFLGITQCISIPVTLIVLWYAIPFIFMLALGAIVFIGVSCIEWWHDMKRENRHQRSIEDILKIERKDRK